MEPQTIFNHDNVIRRLYRGWIDKDIVTSLAFLDRSTNEPSVHLERLADARTILQIFPSSSLAGLALLNVGDIRSRGLGEVEHRPVDSDRSHCVISERSGGQLGKKKRARELARLARIIWQAIPQDAP